MKKYEAMFILKPGLSEDERKALFSQINDAVTNKAGIVSGGNIWAEKRKLYFPLKKHHEGLYYLLNFSISPLAVKEIEQVYRLNESILRVMVTKIEE